MNKLNSHGTRFALLMLAAATAVGCTNPIRDAKNDLEDAREDLDSPSGKVEASTVPDALEAQFAGTDSGSPVGVLGFNLDTGHLPTFGFRSGSTSGVAMPDAYELAAIGGIGSLTSYFGNCIDEDEGEMVIDLACLGKDVGEDMSGKIILTYDEDENTSSYFLYHIEYQKACYTYDGDKTCIDGTGAFEAEMDLAASTFDMLITADFTVTHGGTSTDYEFAVRMSMDASGAMTMEFLVYVDGASFVIIQEDQSVDIDDYYPNEDENEEDKGEDNQEEAPDFKIRGSNGEFSCHYGDSGDDGSCKGASGKFDWSN